jgi:hypothetical protein
MLRAPTMTTDGQIRNLERRVADLRSRPEEDALLRINAGEGSLGDYRLLYGREAERYQEAVIVGAVRCRGDRAKWISIDCSGPWEALVRAVSYTPDEVVAPYVVEWVRAFSNWPRPPVSATQSSRLGARHEAALFRLVAGEATASALRRRAWTRGPHAWGPSREALALAEQFRVEKESVGAVRSGQSRSLRAAIMEATCMKIHNPIQQTR